MAAKILISGPAMAGKTSLLQTLEDVYVIAHDGKRYPFAQPHTNVETFSSAQELVDLTNEKLLAYKEKFGRVPSTVVYDSVSKIQQTIEANVLARVKSFPYGEINKEIKIFTDYIEQVLIANGVNVVLVSHALWNEETALWSLVGAGGAFSKKGGLPYKSPLAA